MSSAREFAVRVVTRLQEAGHTALWAGGCVRDLLLGLDAADYDVATSATPDQVRELFGHRRTLAVGASFGVIVVVGRGDEGQVEVATFRTEGPYLDGRRPEKVAFATPEQDALRRDFTINGLFLDPLTDQVFDYVGGRADLERKVLRAIGDPVARFREDKLRMLRGVRMAARFDYALEPGTAAAIAEHAAEILVVSQERIAQELRKMLEHPRRVRAIELALELGLLERILPESVGDIARGRLSRLEKPSFALSLAALVADCGAAKVPCRRLKLSNETTDRVVWLVEQLRVTGDLTLEPPARIKRLLQHPGATELRELARADADTRGIEPRAATLLSQALQRWPPEEIDPPPLVDGNDLLRAGVRPGREMGRWLYELRDAQLNGEVGSVTQAMEWIARRVPAG
jgi:poly(A) polymerase